jgi:hypothetical protein
LENYTSPATEIADALMLLGELVSRGRPVARFERKPGMRAEALDAVTYGLAAKAALSLSAAAFDQRADDLCHATPAAAPPAVIPSKWMMS